MKNKNQLAQEEYRIPPKGFPARLAFYRKLRGMTQAELGEKIGVTSNQISRWERGEIEPTLGYLLKLGEVLNVNLGYLTDQPKEENDNFAILRLDGLEELFDATEELIKLSGFMFTNNRHYTREMNIAANLFALAYKRTLARECEKAEQDALNGFPPF